MEGSRAENPKLVSGAIQFHPLGLKELAAEATGAKATLAAQSATSYSIDVARIPRRAV